MDALRGHPKAGASWEGLLVEQLAMLPPDTPLHSFGTHTGAELDLFFRAGGRNVGVEIKLSEAPKVTRSMRHVIHDLALNSLYVLHAGTERYPLDDRIEALPASQIAALDEV